ncbi:hypothetical protein YOLOSWAG_143 [Erwinia phage vB_EamM_Yoloswag]|uniref:Uncharacterized protein n=1 Tax=Erwinia phage vB_EamM_Yoloswag TaxID=1958956 RepID=A0A1S6L379_9CAUD|nr:hypothetical protein HOR66_gp143 [Erwinia phage vB_EamM_Yoloswag]AQT28623.1 hypothetical protein YOLOSWAG_143 [Erwinia phage vB_EamM_Yoloswag]
MAAKKKLGKGLTKEEIDDIIKRTSNPGVASRIMAEVSGTGEQNTFKTLARVAIGLSIVAATGAGLVAATAASGSVMPLLLGAYFINRIIDDPTSTVARLNSIAAPITDKLARLFDSWWSSLDVERLKDLSKTESLSAAARITFKKITARSPYDDSEKTTYVINRAGKNCGVINWDKSCGSCSEKSTGWVVTLFDGFNETAYRSGRGQNANEPFTAVHKGEVKLQNPSRMTLDLARSWARGALRA